MLLAAKQEAFEESIKLKNQFRNLDEDEVEFLDSVLESTRKKELDVRRDTSEQLNLFRRQQEKADKTLLENGERIDDTTAEEKAEAGESQWAVNAKKRKRAKEREGLKGIKLQRSSTSQASNELNHNEPGRERVESISSSLTRPDEKRSLSTCTRPPTAAAANTITETARVAETLKVSSGAALGLADYSSDEED